MSLDERDHAAAVLTVLNTALSPACAYTRGEVPGLDGLPGREPDEYALVDLERRGGLPVRACGATGRSGWRLTVRAVAVHTDNARRLLALASAALDFTALSVDGDRSTPLQLESADAVEADDGRHSGALVWTYAL